MQSPSPESAVLARWTLDAPAWQAFVREVRAQPHGDRRDLRDDSDAGRTVVVSGAALQVGRERLDLARFHVHRVVERGTWLQLVELDDDYPPFPLPLPTDAALAAWARDHFRQLAARNALESARRMAEYEAARNAPTPSNRLRRFVERHFIVLLLLLFFVLLPACAWLAAWLSGASGA